MDNRHYLFLCIAVDEESLEISNTLIYHISIFHIKIYIYKIVEQQHIFFFLL